MATELEVRALAKSLGAILHLVDKESEFTVEAPDGKVWKATDTHELVISAPGPGFIEDLWRDALKDMNLGLEPCSDPECEWCYDWCDDR